MSVAATATATRSPVTEAFAIVRFPITLIAMTSTVVFGWLTTGRYLWPLALTVGADWFVINLMNRVTDVAEDLRNHIPGTERVAQRQRALTLLCLGLLIALVAGTALVWPALTPYRIAVQVIGLAYNYRLVPTPRGRRRLKEIYLLKNLGSSGIFALTSFAYPIAATGVCLLSWSAIAVLVAFFMLFEMTFEILYDVRDHEGDRVEGIPTFPVVHGIAGACRIIDALLVASALILVAGLVAGSIGVREALMVVAPAVQLGFYRPRVARGLTTHDCIVLTHLGSVQLACFLIGTALWLHAGLPANFMVR